MPDSTTKLLQFTDTHLYGSEAQQLRGVATYPALLRTLHQAREDIAHSDALLVTGDIVQDDPAGYALFRRLFANLGKPVYCIPGNHDDAAALGETLAQPPFQVGGSFDVARWRIVLLDSSLPGLAQGHLSDESLAFLESSLAAAPQRHALICLHHHPVRMDSRWLDTVSLTNSAAFLEVVDRHPQVRAIVWGHVHQAYEGRRHAVRLFGTPSTCAQFLPRSASFALDHQPPAYRRLALHPDGSIASEVVWVGQAGENADQARTATSQNSLRA